MSGKRTRFYVEIKGYHENVTGSCIENIITWPNGEKFRFLIDYGMYQEKEYEELTFHNNVMKEINDCYRLKKLPKVSEAVLVSYLSRCLKNNYVTMKKLILRK